MREGWKLETLGGICQIKPPKREAKEKLSDSDLVSFVPMRNLGLRQKDLLLNEERPLNKVVGSYTYFADNDVLLAKITPCFENGKLGIARNLINGVGFGSSEYIVFRSKGNIDPEYLFYFLSQDSFRDDGARVMTGAVGHKRVPKGYIENYPIPIPPVHEQKRIVAILDEAFKGIDKATVNAIKNFSNVHELFESHLNNIFISKGEGWVEKTLEDVCVIKPPKNEAKKHLADTDLVSFVPMNKLGKCRKDILLDTDKPLADVTGSYTYFANNDVLLAKITPCFENGKLGIANNLTNGIGFGSSEFIVFRSKGEIDPEYLFYFLSRDSFRSEGARVMTGAVGHKRVPKEFIEQHAIPLPSLSEQKRVIRETNKLAVKTECLEVIYRQKLTALTELKQSLLQKAFVGELIIEDTPNIKKEAVA